MAKKKEIIDEEKDETSLINDSDLSHASEDDEASLSAALAKNPLKMSLIRSFIKIKNHIKVIPLLMAIVSMIVITFTIPYHVNAMAKLHNDEMNAFYFFCNVLLSLLVVMAYLRVSSKKSSRAMVISMTVVFYLLLAAEIAIDFSYLHDVQVEMGLFNNLNKVQDDDVRHYVANSYLWTYVHIVCLFVTAGMAFVAPMLQPLTRKLHIKVK